MTIYLGVDVAQATLDAVGATEQKEEVLRCVRNSQEGWEVLAKKVRALAEALDETTVHLIVEPTGGYERGLVDYAYALGWLVTVVNPFYVRRFIQGQGQRGKTDSIDALMLARYGLQQQPDFQWQVAEDARELQELLNRQDDLKKMLQAERNRLKQVQHNPRTPLSIHRSIERSIRYLHEELEALDEAIQELLHSSPDFASMETLLRTTPGVGRKVSLRLLALFHRFYAMTAGQGRSNQLVAFLGLDPQPYESGRSLHMRSTISRMGDKVGRATLYMGAIGGIRGNNPLKAFYERLIQRGKAHKLALVACSRKILVWAWAVFSSRQPFDPQRVLPNPQIPS